ncbi:GGDEF and EAL domain-containing protein [Moritella sp. F3]|uniref:GGDEF and EAL domain-containing protein n=1 Tax=Moritella sp. F3 TaxID=2718882 RepID=UPI0018E132D6|nr:GGDEF and EAL domain-containing protein [Moritella sp. F3]GIC79403.1 sensor domain-containing phosphodiesterase [Moritella sp. F1]GIC80339.1 sensor domain-containing phosphodiesterase [Moritella sp. F3]
MLNINTQVIEIPESMFRGWQQTVELIAGIMNLPAALIMRVHHSDVRIFSSNDAANVVSPLLSESKQLSCYCAQVIYNRAELVIEDAALDFSWFLDENVSADIMAYYGLPLTWPNDQAFGTLCVLDAQAREFTPHCKLLITRFQQSMIADLTMLYEKAELLHANRKLQTLLSKKSMALSLSNQALLHEQDSRSALESTLVYQQQYDALTGIANQLSLVNQMDDMLESVDDDNELAVIYLGIRNFKSINNSYGYAIGDKVLLEVSQRIHQQLTTEYLVARCWGDAFAIVVRDENVVEQVIDLIARLTHSFELALAIEDFTITTQLCFGIALADSPADQGISLVEKAEAAMTANKDTGCHYNFFTDELSAVIGERHYLESHLAEALDKQEMSVHYQPMICVKTQRVLGAEALIRWRNPILGAVAPDRFINLAEQNGQILALGNFVLRTAMKQAAQWRNSFGDDFCIAVNISPVQLRDDNLVSRVAQLLAYYQLPGTALELEITEGVLLQDEKKVTKSLAGLKSLGVSISLDDFGTGYSSLSYLQKYSFDTLKIDRSFIMNSMECGQDKELARAIIAMAKKLNLQVVAEGVETPAQHQFIVDEGCDYGQGYLYGKPVPATMFTSQYLSRQAI